MGASRTFRLKRAWGRFICRLFGHVPVKAVEGGPGGWAVFERCPRCRSVIEVTPMGI